MMPTVNTTKQEGVTTNMNNNKTYIKPYEVDDLDKLDEPSKDELMLDNSTDFEYTTPYTDNYDDITDGIGDIIEAGGIFDDR